MDEGYPELGGNLRLENQRLEGAGHDNDDDFEEFGGFEAAEPVAPHEAQPMAAGPDAGGLPWAMFPADMSQRPTHSQPDLLCAQNTFPRHLDSPPSVHDRLAADGSVPGGGSVVNHFEANLLPDIGQNLNVDRHGMQSGMMNGMFNAAPPVEHQSRHCDLNNSVAGVDLVSPAGPSWRRPSNSYGSHDGMPMPEVPDLNQSAAWRRGSSSSGCPSIDDVINGPQHYVPADQRLQQQQQQPPQPQPPPQQQQQQQHPAQHHQQLQQPSMIEDLGGAIGGVPIVQNHERRRRDHTDGSRDSYLLKQLDELRARNIELTSRVDGLQTQLSEQKTKYEALQAKHASDLEAIRQAGHDALAVVVEEYKTLCQTAMLQQQEVAESHLKEKLKNEADQYAQMLQEQHDHLSDVLKREKEENESRMKNALDEHKNIQRGEFESYFEMEQNRYQAALQKVLMEEQCLHQKAIEKAMQEQKEQSQEAFKEEMKLMKSELESIQEGYLEERKKALESEKESREKLLNDLVEEERRKSRQIGREVLQSCKEEMKNYVAEQRQLDNQLRQRHYAALDLFLESARQQLRLLMERDSNVVMPPADDPRPAGAEASARPPTDSNPQPSSSSSKQDNPPSSNSS